MKIRLKTSVVVMNCAFTAMASGQMIRGTGDNSGGGWVSDGHGGYQATGGVAEK